MPLLPSSPPHPCTLSGAETEPKAPNQLIHPSPKAQAQTHLLLSHTITILEILQSGRRGLERAYESCLRRGQGGGGSRWQLFQAARSESIVGAAFVIHSTSLNPKHEQDEVHPVSTRYEQF